MCCTKGLFRRLIPFFLTFAAGLLIASFFVPVTGPNFRFGRRRQMHMEYDRQRDEQIQKLREENIDLKVRLDGIRDSRSSSDGTEDLNVPPVLDEIPPPPMPPKHPAPIKRVR